MKNNDITIVFTGGGTLGSVTPLLALYDELLLRREITIHSYWIGTKNGIEKDLVSRAGISYESVPAAKLRRYFSLRNFVDPFLLVAGLIKSTALLHKIKPQVVVSAGGFVAVPVMWAAWLMNIKSIILQLDIKPGLANILTVMGATTIGVAFKEEAKHFPSNKTEVVGIPVRRSVLALNNLSEKEKNGIALRYHLDSSLPVVVVIGGGTGSLALNTITHDALGELVKDVQVVHITGRGKQENKFIHPNYHVFEFLGPELIDYLVIADVVVTRAGMGMLSELSVLGKPCIIIPIPKSHQVANAEYFSANKAGVYITQDNLTAEVLTSSIKKILTNAQMANQLSVSIKKLIPSDASKIIVDRIISLQ